MSKQKTMMTFEQRLALADWLRTPGNPEKVRECPTEAEAIRVAAQDLPWLTEDYLLAFRNLRKKMGIPTGRGAKTRAKQAAAKRAKETPKSLEDRVVQLTADVESLVSEMQALCGVVESLQNNILTRDVLLSGLHDKIAELFVRAGLTPPPLYPPAHLPPPSDGGWPSDPLPDHLRGPQCSSVKPNPPAPRILKESQDMSDIQESN